jgi:hypothetical protein
MMKKLTLVMWLFIAFSVSLSAQFKIQTNGEARLWTNNVGPWDNTFMTYPSHDYSKCYIVQKNNQSRFYVTGNGEAWSTGFMNLSDRRFKKNIQSIDIVQNLYSLEAKKYQFKAIDSSSFESESDFYSQEHFGFIAQDVKELFPSLISEDEHGFLAINYVELIPVLVEGMKQQKNNLDLLQLQNENLQTEVIALREDINSIRAMYMQPKGRNKSSSIETIDINVSKASLLNCKPNPFNDETTIEYFIPSDLVSAYIVIHDTQGNEVKKITLTQSGNSFIVVKSDNLKAGLYSYSLVYNGKLIDTKKMILTIQ